MKLSLIDKSNYFKGLLLLIGKDEKVTKPEKEIVMKLGETLGFEKSFRENAINTLLENEYISQDPPVFSNPEIAKSFIKDGIKLILSDPGINQNEVDWLDRIASANNLSQDWLSELILASQNRGNYFTSNTTLEVVNHL